MTFLIVRCRFQWGRGAIASIRTTSVSITNNSNYDEGIRRTPLNDIICEYCSSYLYVIGGYADESLLDAKTKPLLEVTADNLAMLGRLNFFLLKTPTLQVVMTLQFPLPPMTAAHLLPPAQWISASKTFFCIGFLSAKICKFFFFIFFCTKSYKGASI